MEIKFKIIETESYLLAVSGRDIKPNVYALINGILCKTEMRERKVVSRQLRGGATMDICKTEYLEIIAYQPKGNVPKLDLPLLPEIVVEDDVEKLAEKAIQYSNLKSSNGSYKSFDDKCVGFIEGYKAATKVYSEDDLREVIKDAVYTIDPMLLGTPDFNKECDRVIRSLKQPKTTPKWFVAKTDYLLWKNADDNEPLQNKLETTTINGKEYLVGKFLNE